MIEPLRVVFFLLLKVCIGQILLNIALGQDLFSKSGRSVKPTGRNCPVEIIHT